MRRGNTVTIRQYVTVIALWSTKDRARTVVRIQEMIPWMAQRPTQTVIGTKKPTGEGCGEDLDNCVDYN